MTRPASQSPVWIDKRLEQAFHLLDAVLVDLEPGTDAHRQTEQARGLVEDADHSLEMGL